MKIRPLLDRVLLSAAVEQKTEGGIIIPKSSDDKSLVMSVVAVAEGSKLSIGDRVIVAKYAGTEVNMGGEKFVLVCEYDILGVVS